MRTLLLTLLLAALGLACDTAEEETPYPIALGTFEATVSGDTTATLSGTALVTVDALTGEPELFLKLQAPPQFILLSKPSLAPLAERTYPVGSGSDDPEAFSGAVALPPAIYLVQSGTVTVDRVTEGSAAGTFDLAAGFPFDTTAIQVEGTFRALVP